jgi:sec-independent protein translocase protein TatB
VFGLGSLEILVILALALVVLGPRRLPEVARQMGRFYGQIRRTTYELRTTLDRELREEERSIRRETAVVRREELETIRREREATAQERLKDAPKEPVVAEEAKTSVVSGEIEAPVVAENAETQAAPVDGEDSP